jgi:hypothetical protein
VLPEKGRPTGCSYRYSKSATRVPPRTVTPRTFHTALRSGTSAQQTATSPTHRSSRGRASTHVSFIQRVPISSTHRGCGLYHGSARRRWADRLSRELLSGC